MKTKLLSLLLLLSIISNSQTVIKWVKTDKITARTDTIVFDSIAKFNNGATFKDSVNIDIIHPEDSNSLSICNHNNSSILTFGDGVPKLGSINAYMGTYKGIDLNMGNYYKNGVWYRSLNGNPSCFFMNHADSTISMWWGGYGLKNSSIAWTTPKFVFSSKGKMTANSVDVDSVFIGNDTIYRIGISNDTLYFNNQTFTGGGGSTGFKWIVTGGGTDKIYTAVQAASVGDVVIVDAGAYTETNTISKDGVRLHFMNGAVVTKTTAGALFDITGSTNNFYLTGDGEFNTVNEFVNCTSFSGSVIDLEYSKASNTGVGKKLINIDVAGLVADVYINGKIKSESSGGNVIYKYTGTGITSIKGGIYSNTSAYDCLYIGGYGTMAANPTPSAISASASASNASYKGIYITGLTSQKFGNINAKKIDKLYINGEFNGSINGEVGVYTENNSIKHITFNNVVGTATIIATQGSYNFMSRWDVLTLTGGATVNLFGTNLNLGELITQSAGIINHYGTIEPWNTTENRRLFNITGGTLRNYGTISVSGGLYLTRRVSYCLINGATAKVINYGIWDCPNPASNAFLGGGELIQLQAGTFENRGYMRNRCEGNGGYCIRVTGNSTFIHDGGRMILNPNYAGSSIYNAASTLTIKNYNNYFTNIARSGAGTYTETITGGGTEVVDTDVTE